MTKRLGEVREANDSDGMWLRIATDGITNNQDFYGSNFRVQGGFDKLTWHEEASTYLGFVGSFMSGSAGKSISARNDGISLGFYRSSLFSDNHLDIVGRYIYSYNQYTVNTPEFSGKRDTRTHSGYMSAEYGRRLSFVYKREFYIQPRAQAILGYVSAQNFKFDNTADTLHLMSNPRFVSIVGIGLDMSSMFALAKVRGYWRVGGSVLKDLGIGKVSVRDDFAHTSTENNLRLDFHTLINMSFDIEVASDTRIYLGFEKSFFGSYNVDYALSAGVRHNFGNPTQKTFYPKFLDQQYLEYPGIQRIY
ncbi:MAG: autotransporter outer membrane beta-barrel domain-containing protein [Helicobacter sp.]|nr:autotransporter outer membrane beta-barrel domain-containing protein [Helicobacter sp.]